MTTPGICEMKKAVYEARRVQMEAAKAKRLEKERAKKCQPAEDLTGLVCWWCVHPFPEGLTRAIHAPTAYDDRLDRFTTRGNFCSWACAKAWISDKNMARAGEWCQYLAQMRLQALGHHEPCWPAPKREMLKEFGGKLTIEEFRGFGGRVEPPQVYWPDEHRINFGEVKMDAPTVQIMTQATASRGKLQAIEAATGSGESLKLRRTKPLARAESKLENVLGITRKVK